MKHATAVPKPEPVFRINCDMPPWMSAYLETFARPFFSVSNRERIVETNNLAAGTFQPKACRESYGVHTQSVPVPAGEIKQITVTYKGHV